MAAYQYSTLKKNGIRLATLRPGALHDTLYIELQEVETSLTEPPVFEALSYVWGSTENKVPVQVSNPTGESILMVTQNLATALRNLRFEDRPRVLWVDALCIDQSNLAERSQQVLKMGDIYNMCQRVIAWLGPKSKDSSLAMDTIARLAPSIELHRYTKMPQPSAKSGLKLDIVTARNGWLTISRVETISIYHLIHREWFERLWVCQEIALGGSRSFLLCGRKEILWTDFCAVIRYIYTFRNELIHHHHEDGFRKRLVLLWNLLKLEPGISLISLQRFIGLFKCEDPRDRIYALLSLLHPMDQEIGIIPNYSLTHSQVYRNTTLAWISHYHSLEILSRCEYQVGTDLPSWVPNWAIFPSTECRLVCRDNVHFWSRRYRPPTDLDSTLEALPISCKFLATIERTVAPKPFERHNFENWLRRILPKNFRGGSYQGKQSLLEAYSLTLCGHETRESFFPPDIHYQSQKERETALTAFLSGDYEGDDELRASVPTFLIQAETKFQGRCFFWGTDGSIGLAPEAARPGDRVCNILGCSVPIVLRPRPESDDRYSVVGECYIHGLMHNEGLLGDLPKHIRPVIAHDAEFQGERTQYQDTTNGEVRKEDPRVLRLLEDLISKKVYTRHDIEQVDLWGTAGLIEYYCTDIKHCTLV
ncbi:hypothetical protein O1611_g3878 [Lasiodiplodia mahajangana]|uniref:Uncharacterized protein n=1 Tax=Lasiodiplodia mahajangana TaxID=1108764 RepID=A0ACC2JQG0_9PEZI|nr:hypothetical protein O1611_g3878 [Lasiodiplodia mahajangana]